MNGASIIFYLVFVIPLIVFIAWLMRQDKRKGKIGLVVLVVLIVGVIVYMYSKKMFSLKSEFYQSTGMIL
jgi:cbb3-type cytochrome oxidase subunit 3